MTKCKMQFQYNHFFSFFPVNRATREIPLTATTLNLIPGISPFDFPFLPKPATKTSSFSDRQLRQPSQGTKAATFLPFFLSITLTPFLTAELGCLDSTPIFSTTRPLAMQLPMKGFLNLEQRSLALYSLSFHFWSLRLVASFRPALIPLGLPEPIKNIQYFINQTNIVQTEEGKGMKIELTNIIIWVLTQCF